LTGRGRLARRAQLAGLGLAILASALGATQPPAAGQAASVVPRQLRDVGFEQRVGESVPLDAVFRDHTGAEVRLGDLLGERPAILALVYYDCPMLCSLVLQGLTRNLRALSFDVGSEFDVIAVSFDPSEGPAEASGNRREVVAAYGRQAKGDAEGRGRLSPTSEGGRGSEGEGGDRSGGWHFLTGSEEAVGRITSAVGFRYRYDDESGEFAHAAGVVILTPDGRAARYLYGVDFPARDLRLALVEAGQGEVGSVVDQALLYCYRYDPKAGKYSAATLNIVRLGGIATVLALATFLTVSWRREARLRRA